MKYLLIISLIVASSHARYEDEMLKVGFVQPLIVDAISSMGDGSCRHLRESIEEERIKTINCLAEIKSNNSFCYTFVGHFERCTKNLVDKVESCIQLRTQGLPAAFVKTLVAQVQFICGTDGEHILEIFNPCIYKIVFTHDENNCTRTFEKNMRGLKDKNERMLPGACREVIDYKTCITEPFKAQCQNDITRNTVQEIFNGFMTTCKDINTTE